MHPCTLAHRTHPISSNECGWTYHIKIISTQQHFKLHWIFHQALWMANLLRNSNNSLTSPLEQKTVKKTIQAAASVSPCSMTVWPASERWIWAGGLLVVNNPLFKHHDTCCGKDLQDLVFWGPWFQQNACWIWGKHIITIHSTTKLMKYDEIYQHPSRPNRRTTKWKTLVERCQSPAR